MCLACPRPATWLGVGAPGGVGVPIRAPSSPLTLHRPKPHLSVVTSLLKKPSGTRPDGVTLPPGTHGPDPGHLPRHCSPCQASVRRLHSALNHGHTWPGFCVKTSNEHLEGSGRDFCLRWARSQLCQKGTVAQRGGLWGRRVTRAPARTARRRPGSLTLHTSVHYVQHVITGRAPGRAIRPSARLRAPKSSPKCPVCPETHPRQSALLANASSNSPCGYGTWRRSGLRCAGSGSLQSTGDI